MKKSNFILLGFAIAAMTFSFQSCYYDVEAELYPNTSNSCDTTNVTYTNSVKSIVDTYCATTGCHASGANAPTLDSYQNVVDAVNNTGFMCDIRHDSGCDPMPQGQSKLTDCNIAKLTSWQSKNFPN